MKFDDRYFSTRALTLSLVSSAAVFVALFYFTANWFNSAELAGLVAESAFHGWTWGTLYFFISLLLFTVVYALSWVAQSANERARDSECTAERAKGEMQRVMRESKKITALFDSVSANVPGVIFRYEIPSQAAGVNGCFKFMSEGSSEMFGLNSIKILGDASLFIQLIDDEEKPGVLKRLDAAVRNQSEWVDRFKIQLYNGQDRWLEVAARLHEDEGKVFYDGIFTDVTEQFLSQERTTDLNAELQREVSRANKVMLELEDANKVNSHTIRTVSQEIRNAINGVSGLMEMLLAEDPSEQQREHMDLALETVRALLPVVCDLVDRTYLQSGVFELADERACVEGLVDDSILFFANRAQKREVRLVSEIDDAVPAAVMGDSNRLRQILFNLLDNSIKATEDGTVTVRVSVEETDADSEDWLLFEVIDTGRGMSTDQLHRLLAQGGDDSCADTIGLPFCCVLVDRLHGHICGESKLGEGTTIQFRIPLITAEGEEVEMNGLGDVFEHELEGDVPPLKILLAEDYVVNQKICRYRVEGLGHQLVTVDNGQEAIQRLAAEKFDLVLMDCSMPVLDGISATRRIRDGAAGVKDREIYIIAVTARALLDERRSIKSAGMNDYVSKPFEVDELDEAIRRGVAYIKARGVEIVGPAAASVTVAKGDAVHSRLAGDSGAQKKPVITESLGRHISREEVDALLSITGTLSENKERDAG